MTELLVETRDRVLIATINRPERKNALTDKIYGLLIAALDEASANSDIVAVILTGAGDAFCSGVDTRQISSKSGVFEGKSAPTTRHKYTHGVQKLSEAFYRCDVPLIAAVNGPALGLGFDLTTHCDIRIAAENATFSEAFITFGLIPGDGGFWTLPRIVGYSRAVEMTITGKRINAETAERWGLVSEVVPEGGALDAALKLCEDIKKRPPHTVRLSKKLIKNAINSSFAEALDMGAMAQAVLTGSDDQLEAGKALMERRDPNYTAR